MDLMLGTSASNQVGHNWKGVTHDKLRRLPVLQYIECLQVSMFCLVISFTPKSI